MYHVLNAGLMLNSNQMLKYLPVNEIEVDASYQRALIMSHVDKIYREFNEQSIGIVNVALRKSNGKYYNMDGNHRLTAIKWRLRDGLSAPTHVLCLITIDTDLPYEAQRFVELNSVKPVSGNSKFQARLCSNGSPECEIRDCLGRNGFVIDFLPGGRPTSQVRTINGVRGPAKLLEAWSKCNSSFEQAVIFFKTALSDANGFVPYDYRKGEIIYSLCLLLQTQGIKDGKALGEKFKNQSVDFSIVIDNAKEMCDTRWGMFKAIANALGDTLGLRRRV